jgi:uncharacterized protein
MSTAGQGALLASLFFTGLAGSLHCVGMCGPILLGFSRVLASGGRSRLDFVTYHAGRLWTYGLLGLLAGWAGARLHQSSAVLGWQRPLSVAAAALVIAGGAAALGWFPGWKLDLSPPGGCLPSTGGRSWLAALLHDRRRIARLLLGAVMGLLPCGLVYAAVLVAATLPNPLYSALGMVLFGIGTLPALSAVVLGSWLAPRWLRESGTRIAAGLLIGTGFFMLARALWVSPAAHGLH